MDKAWKTIQSLVVPAPKLAPGLAPELAPQQSTSTTVYLTADVGERGTLSVLEFLRLFHQVS